jgi:peptidoglycan-associated lipoprotein
MKQVMTQATPLVTGMTLIALFSLAACSHKAVAVSKPADITPVATVAPQPTPTPAKGRTDAAPARGVTQVAAQQSRPTAMPKETADKLKSALARLEDALFDYDQSTIRSDASVALRDDVNIIRGILADYPNQKLVVEGHADERGSAEYNLALGDRRAHAVQEFLSSQGIPGPQLAVVSYGKERPVCTEESESCWQKNRRAHVTAAP